MSQQQSQPHNNANSIAGKQRNNGKGKFLTRSHAMHECTSPPQTPTPRTSNSSQSSLPLNNEQSNKNDSTSIATANKTSSVSPITVSTNNSNSNSNSNNGNSNNNNNNSQNNAQQTTSTTTPNLFVTNGNLNASQLDLEFPKLTPPKSKSPRNQNPNNNSSPTNNTDNNHSNENTGNDAVTMNGGGSSSSVSSTTVVIQSQNNSTNNHDNYVPWSKQSANDLDANNPPMNKNQEKPSCTILVNDVGKKCDSMLPGNNQANSFDESFSDKEKSNADENSNLVEFVYKKNRNSSVAKGGAGGSGGSGKSRQKHNNQSINITVGIDATQNASNGCQSDYYSTADNSTDHFTDQSGVDLLQFFKITLNKNAKDRYMLLRVEKELSALVQDQSRDMIKFPTMSSYNRMLIHRVAAWFGMEHNVDSTVQCVIVNTTKSTRLPEIRFKSLLTDTFSDEAPSRKSILKRDAHSFEEYRQGLLACPDRGFLERKAKSFEEREQEYEKVKRRIFKDEKNGELELFLGNLSKSGNKEHPMKMDKNAAGNDNQHNHNDDTMDAHKLPRFNEMPNWMKNQNNRLMRVKSSPSEQRMESSRPCVEKSHSFGGYGPPSHGRLARGDSVGSSKTSNLSKQDSCNSQPTWRLSPSSSGYKTQSQSLRSGSDSVTPSPSYSSENHTPEPTNSVSSGIVWAVTDMSSVPKGSVLIDPQTLKPMVNRDGTIYHFDPSNLPPCGKLPRQSSSPTASTMPNENTNSQSRKKGRNVTDEIPDKQCDKENSSMENCKARKSEAKATFELEITSSEPTKNISMNSLLSPLDKVYSETKDNNLNRIDADNCPDVAVHPTVKNQSTSPQIPNDSDAQSTTTDNSSPAAKIDNNSSQNPNENKDAIVTTNQVCQSDRPQQATNVVVHAGGKKDEIKILPAVVPVLGYAPPGAQNVYPPIEPGVPLYTGAQPAQSATFPTTYQQGLDGNIYTIPQPMIYGYPTVDNEYHGGGIFLPMYDQSGTQLPPNAQQTDQTSSTTDYRRGVPLAFYEPHTQQTMAVVPVAYPSATSASPYGPAHNLYPGQIVYTSDQYNAAAAAAAASSNQVPQYINYPISYTYPYNGTPYPYWGQAVASAGIEPQQHHLQVRRGPSIGSENTKAAPPINESHTTGNVSTSAQSSSHTTTFSAKNSIPLLASPNEIQKSSLNKSNNIDEPDSKDNSIHSSVAYDRKNKNPLNSNRKQYNYRGGFGNVMPNQISNSIANNQSSSSALQYQIGGRKPMYRNDEDNMKRTDDGNKKNDDGNKKIPPHRHQSIAESSGNNHVYTSGAGHPYSEKSTPPTYDRANNSHNYDKRPINNNKPLIVTLPMMNHMDRPRAPRPKPLDLRRSVSNRNTPSTNSTESNNSPNSIVSNELPNTPNHSQQQSQQHTPVQSSPSYNSSQMVSHSGQHNVGARMLRMYHGDLIQNQNDQLASSSSAGLCGDPFAYNPHSGMYFKLGKTFLHHSMSFPNKAQQNDLITGIYPTMNMMLGYPAARPVGPRSAHVNHNYHKNNRTPR